MTIAWQRRGTQLPGDSDTDRITLGVKPDDRLLVGRPGALPPEPDSSPRRRRERPTLSDRATARHRSPQRAVTFLSDASETVTGQLAILGRSSAVLAASTGMIATAGMTTYASGAKSEAPPMTSTDPSTTANAVSAGLFGSVTGSARTPVSAPMSATVTFESSGFRAEPTVIQRADAPAKTTVTPRTTDNRTADSRTAENRTAGSRATDSKATDSRTGSASTAATKKATTRPADTKPINITTTKTAPASVKTTTVADKPASGRGSTAPRQATTTSKTSPETAAAETKGSTSADAPATTGRRSATPPKASNQTAIPPKPSHSSTPAKGSRPAKSKTPSQSSGSTRGSSVLAIASRYLGTRYLYGGTSPRGFDCSGYTGYVYRQLGVSLPRTANQQMLSTNRVSRSKARVGDLVFFTSGGRAYHVGIYAGNGKMYDAPRAGKTVQKRAIWDASVVFGRVSR